MVYATVTVTGKILRDGAPAVGKAILTPNVNTISDTNGNVVLYGPLVGVLDATGAFSIVAPATDDANLRPDFGYTLRFDLASGSIPPTPLFGLPAATVTIDITDILPEPTIDGFIPVTRGYSAYELAVQNGYVGTQAQWLEHITAYGQAVESGFVGTQQQWLDSLVTGLSIGTVTTNAPGSPATASITGAAPNQVLNLGITKGDQGIQGPVGLPNTLAVGTVTSVPNGTAPSVNITGASPNQTINFVLEAGPTGPQGIPGPPGSGSISTVNGDPGPNIVLTKSWVGLANVDNTSDAAKPVSTATQAALDGKASVSHTHPESALSFLLMGA